MFISAAFTRKPTWEVTRSPSQPRDPPLRYGTFEPGADFFTLAGDGETDSERETLPTTHKPVQIVCGHYARGPQHDRGVYLGWGRRDSGARRIRGAHRLRVRQKRPTVPTATDTRARGREFWEGLGCPSSSN